MKLVLLLLSGWKPSRGRLLRRHHVSDGRIRQIRRAARFDTGTDNRRSIRRNVRLVRMTVF